MELSPDRLKCLVPFCRRTRKNDGTFREWICGNHWPLVPKAIKAEWRTVRARTRIILRYRPVYREYWTLAPGCPQRIRAVSMWLRYDQAWGKCKAAAIEAAGGIA